MTNLRTSVVWKISDENFKKIIKESGNLSEVLRKIGLDTKNGNHKTLNKRIQEEKIDISHMKERRKEFLREHLKRIQKENTIPLNEILVKNSSYTYNWGLRNRLIKEQLLVEECSECKIGPFWNGKSLSLQLDHKNGINNDNRIENLRLLCPNCHSQTETYAGKKNKKKILRCSDCFLPITKYSGSGLCHPCYQETTRKTTRPSRIELINLILTKPFTSIAAQYNVSDNSIRKWCKYEKLPFKKGEIQLKRKELEKELESLKVSN